MGERVWSCRLLGQEVAFDTQHTNTQMRVSVGQWPSILSAVWGTDASSVSYQGQMRKTPLLRDARVTYVDFFAEEYELDYFIYPGLFEYTSLC